jgi:hypothetical protein
MTEMSESDKADLREEYLELKHRIGSREGEGLATGGLRARLADLEQFAIDNEVSLIPPRRFGRRA